MCAYLSIEVIDSLPLRSLPSSISPLMPFTSSLSLNVKTRPKGQGKGNFRFSFYKILSTHRNNSMKSETRLFWPRNCENLSLLIVISYSVVSWPLKLWPLALAVRDEFVLLVCLFVCLFVRSYSRLQTLFTDVEFRVLCLKMLFLLRKFR